MLFKKTREILCEGHSVLVRLLPGGQLIYYSQCKVFKSLKSVLFILYQITIKVVWRHFSLGHTNRDPKIAAIALWISKQQWHQNFLLTGRSLKQNQAQSWWPSAKNNSSNSDDKNYDSDTNVTSAWEYDYSW